MRLLVLSLCACSSQVSLSTPSVRVSGSEKPLALSVRDASGREVLSTLRAEETHDAYRWEDQVLEGWDGYRAHEGAWTSGVKADVTADGARVRISLTATTGNKLALRFRLPRDEHFFGLGERYASVDHRGLFLYSWAEEGGLGAGEATPLSATNPYPNGPSMTYFPVPFLLSSRGYGLRVEGSARSEFHLGDESADEWRIAAVDSSLVLDIYVHANPLDSIADFTADVGRPPVPPDWIFGPRREVGVGDSVDGVPEWQLLRQRHVPTTALDDNVHFLPARSELGREVQLRAWTAQMHAEGFKVLGYATPYVSTNLPGAAGDFAAGMAQDVFVKNADGSLLKVFFSSGEPTTLATIDLTFPAGVAFFQSLLQRAIDLGYDGWMHDFGEYLPPSARMHDGRDGLHAHNDFPLLSAKAAAPLGVFDFVRSGWAGSGGVIPGVWSGDPEATFDETQGLPAQLRAGLNLSMSGAPYWGSDIGGYKCLTSAPNDKEMYLRWAALGAVSPLMMNDTACATVIGPSKQKWTLWSDDETVTAYAALARLHTRLAPYFQALAQQAHATGQPLMMQPFLLFPNEPEALKVDDAFFLGPALYAAPVVRRGQVVKQLWLPPGRYVDLATRDVIEGGEFVALSAPLGTLPLLLVAGQILPMLDASVETLAPATDPAVVSADKVAGVLDAQVALARDQGASLTLADGTQLSAKRGDGDDVQLASTGARRIRWDVIRLP